MKPVTKCEHLPNFDKLTDAQLREAHVNTWTQFHGDVDAFLCSDCKNKLTESTRKQKISAEGKLKK